MVVDATFAATGNLVVEHLHHDTPIEQDHESVGQQIIPTEQYEKAMEQGLIDQATKTKQ